MANKKIRNENMSIISSKDIVCQETTIHISDEKLKSSLSRTYELARKDANQFKIYKLYSLFLSISGTLFLSLITSDFKTYSMISSEQLRTIGWLVCVISFVIGIVLLVINSSIKHSKETDERDQVIQIVLKDILKEK